MGNNNNNAGLASTHEGWMSQIKGLTANDDDDKKSTVDDEAVNNINGIQVCGLDNRGVGRSSIPTDKSKYSTTIMAKDAIAVMDHLGWKKAHVFGHSMGGMIALKLAALVPDRVLSLAVINATGGGYEILPKPCPLIVSVAVRFLLAKTPQERAAVDLDLHFSQGYLDERVGASTRRSILYKEYVEAISETGMQSNHGFVGQFNACWNHKMTKTELERIRSGGFLVSVIHGRQDIVASISHARRFAEKLFPVAKLAEFEGGHLVIRERANEVNEELLNLIRASESEISLTDWTNLPDRTNSDWIVPRMLALSKTSLPSSEQLNRFLVYIFGVFVIVLEYMRRVVGKFKPVKVGSSLTSN
ncbi:hypothetical protein RND81_14G099500 [Saponaria officinalis]|uniref:AB hydrolase-1 domain-containing protein n=1 Tax=Saponaria officinalis TaxID=3572 RepID=A0AAW1GNX9_SAPOF